MQIGETTTLLVILPNEIDDLLNDWVAEQRDPTLTKSEVANMAIRDWLTARGRLDPPGPLQQVDEDMMKLVEEAFPDDTADEEPR